MCSEMRLSIKSVLLGLVLFMVGCQNSATPEVQPTSSAIATAEVETADVINSIEICDNLGQRKKITKDKLNINLYDCFDLHTQPELLKGDEKYYWDKEKKKIEFRIGKMVIMKI